MKFRPPFKSACAAFTGCLLVTYFTACSRDDAPADKGSKPEPQAIQSPGTPDPAKPENALANKNDPKNQQQPPAETPDRSPVRAEIDPQAPPPAAPYSASDRPKLNSPSTDEQVTQFLSAASDADRIAVIRDSAGGESHAPVLRRALQLDSEEIRRAAIQSAGGLPAEDAIDVLSGATGDGSPALAESAVEVAGSHADLEARLAIYRNSLNSPHPNVRLRAITELTEERPKYRIDYIFPSLEDSDPAVSEAASDALQTIFDRPFDTTAEADQWWASNAADYDEKLNLIAPPDPPAGRPE